MKLTKYMGMAMAVAALASCSSDEDMNLVSWQNDPMAVHFSASVRGGEMQQDGQTTAPLDFVEGSKVRVKGNGKSIVYTLNSGVWTPSATDYLMWSEDGKINLEACYPAGDSDANFSEFILPTDQNTPEKMAAADYMTMAPTDLTQPTDGPANASLKLNRQTARIVVKVAKIGTEFISTATLKDVKIYGNSVIPEGEAQEVVAFTPLTKTPESGILDTTYSVLVAPKTAASADKPFITLAVDGTPMTVKGIPAVEAGKSYTYNLTVGKNSVQLGKVTIAEWNYETWGDGNAFGANADPTTSTIHTNGTGVITKEIVKSVLTYLTKTINVNGPINGTDIKTIQDAVEELKKENVLLQTFNLGQATIVEGGTGIVTKANTIGKELFTSMNSLTSLILPASTTTIEAQAFKGLNLQGQIIIPDKVTSIGNGAFAGNKLTEIRIEAPLGNNININDASFTGFTNSKECTLTLHDSWGEKVSMNAQGQQTVFGMSWKYVQNLNGIAFIQIDTANHSITVKAAGTITQEQINAAMGTSNTLKIIGPIMWTDVQKFNDIAKNGGKLQVLDLGKAVPTGNTNLNFQDCTSLTSVTLPETCKKLERSNFMNCTNLSSVNLPKSIEIIESNCFTGCSSLTSIQLPKTLTEIGGNCFNGCTKLNNVVFEEGGTAELKVYDYAFNGTPIESITIPNRLSCIGTYCFANCKSLTNVTIENNGQYPLYIKPQAFYDAKIKSINLPNNTFNIDRNTFSHCYLETLTFSEGGDMDLSILLHDDLKITSINIPKRTVLFGGCASLTSITFEKGGTKPLVIKDSNYGMHITSIEIPNRVTEIGERAFYNANNLSSVTFESGGNFDLKITGENAFTLCNITKIDLPDRLTAIGKMSFTACNYTSKNPVEIWIRSPYTTNTDAGIFNGRTFGSDGQYTLHLHKDWFDSSKVSSNSLVNGNKWKGETWKEIVKIP